MIYYNSVVSLKLDIKCSSSQPKVRLQLVNFNVVQLGFPIVLVFLEIDQYQLAAKWAVPNLYVPQCYPNQLCNMP
jgi:hypothetical protein